MQLTAKNMRPRKQTRLRVQPRRPRGRPKADEREAVETRLLLVARQAFVLNGYGATSLNAIARAARVSKNTLYARFPSKAALLHAIVARQIARVEAELASMAWEDSKSLADRLMAYLSVALVSSLTREILEVNRLILVESYQFKELAQLAWSRFRRGVDHAAQIIDDFAERDRIPCRDSNAAAELLMYSVYGWYNSILITNREVSDKERSAWLAAAVRNFMAGRSAW